MCINDSCGLDKKSLSKRHSVCDLMEVTIIAAAALVVPEPSSVLDVILLVIGKWDVVWRFHVLRLEFGWV